MTTTKKVPRPTKREVSMFGGVNLGPVPLFVNGQKAGTYYPPAPPLKTPKPKLPKVTLPHILLKRELKSLIETGKLECFRPRKWEALANLNEMVDSAKPVTLMDVIEKIRVVVDGAGPPDVPAGAPILICVNSSGEYDDFREWVEIGVMAPDPSIGRFVDYLYAEIKSKQLTMEYLREKCK